MAPFARDAHRLYFNLEKNSMEKEKYTNRLINEQSPYLLQHAHNPVDWYPWTDEAFQRAREEDKPVFLSIGYSTCHWCHVMEKESFQNEAVAELLNKHFVSIKVDREELPHIDGYYMTVSQIITGGGGWPLTIVMTPEKEPFYAATYIPRHSYANRPGMLDLLPALHDAWDNRKPDISKSVSTVMKAVKSAVAPESAGPAITEEIHNAAFEYFERNFDAKNGGFGSAPKFPSAHNLLFLLRYWKRTGDKRALRMVETTLRQMRNGGIYDHLGFGFHRYSTDARWHLPHFEKMLYDQAMISWVYLEAFQATGEEAFGRTASEVFTYVMRDLQSPEGGFHTAEDADSEGEEGLFYLWSAVDLENILGRDYPETAAAFGIRENGNHADEASPGKTGLNILARTDAPLPGNWQELRGRLLAVRDKRVRPFKDDKILADWNGLMISALASGGRVLGNSLFTNAAKKAADFILANMTNEEGSLLHSYREGKTAIRGHLDDYAFFVQGLIDLYQTTFETRYLIEALRFNRKMLELFMDPEDGGFYVSEAGPGSVPFRQKESVDSALPSGNSAAFGNLLRLSWLTGDASYIGYAIDTGRAFSRFLTQYPQGNTMMLAWHELLLAGPVEIIIAGDPGSEDTKEMLAAVRRVYSPETVALLKQAEATESLDTAAPFTTGCAMVDGKATAYVCRNFACNLPTDSIEEMIALVTGAG